MVVLAWIAGSLLAIIAITHIVQRRLPVRAGAAMAVLFDAMPLWLIVSLLLVAAELITGHWLAAAIAVVLASYFVVLIVPRLHRIPPPRWARTAPRLRLGVANVFIDNPTPDDAAAALVACDADVLVIVESTPKFLACFRNAGGDTAFPNIVTDPNDTSDYAVSVVSRLPLLDGSAVTAVGPLRLAVARVEVEGQPLTIAGLNPMATVDPGGYDKWVEQLQALTKWAPSVQGPLVLAGDLNTTRYRPEFHDLLDLGLHDAHDALGKGLSPSFKLSATGPLASVGPVARLDHALYSRGLWPMHVTSLEPNGSDHLPFILSLAVRRQVSGPQRRRGWRRSGR